MMNSKLSLVAAALVAALSTAATMAQDAPKAPSDKGPASARAQFDALLTPEERDQFREKMRNAKSREDRLEVQKQMRGVMEQRAKEKGLEMPRMGQGMAAGPRGPAAQLFTQEERDKARERMRSAKTPEERAQVRKDMRAEMEKRAKDKGVTLPHGQHPGMQTRPGEQARPQLFSQEERQQYREKIRSAKTPDERQKLRAELRAETEKRAKEKGITLPQRQRRDSAPKGAEPVQKS